MTVTIPQQQIDRAVKAVRWLVVLMALLILGLLWTSYDGRREIVDGQRLGCERGKLDRTAIAAAFRGQSDYLNLVLDAASVQEDVKSAARINQAIQNASASSLESRTGDNLDCAEVFPAASLIPLP